jgi:hypothetical protein
MVVHRHRNREWTICFAKWVMVIHSFPSSFLAVAGCANHGIAAFDECFGARFATRALRANANSPRSSGFALVCADGIVKG